MSPQRLVATPRRAIISAALLALTMLAAMGLSAFSLYRSKQVGCDGRDKALAVLRDILVDAEAAAITDQPAWRRASISRFYAVELARVDDARC